MIFWISPVSPVAFLTSSGWRGLSLSVGLMPRTPQGLCTDYRKQWPCGSGDKFLLVEPFLFWVPWSHHCALVLQSDPRRKEMAHVKIMCELFIWLCSFCLKYSEQVTRHGASLPHLFSGHLVATFSRRTSLTTNFTWQPIHAQTRILSVFSPEPLYTHTDTQTPPGCRCHEEMDLGGFGHSCIPSS